MKILSHQVTHNPVPLCDFCSQANPEWAYPVDDFSHKMDRDQKLTWVSVGGWNACGECYKLIESDARDALANRFMDSHFTDWEFDDKLIDYRRKIRILHDEFFAMRSGPAIPESDFIDAPGEEKQKTEVITWED